MSAILNKIKQYAGLIDDIIVDYITDLKSQRQQLVIWAFILNFIVLYLVYLGKADYKLSATCIGLLTVVYAFFFASKSKQAEIENNSQVTVDDEPPASPRDPDAIDTNA